ncbi:hypothetical protein TSAR_001716 [Trichomalopsis sarcophagae]|uniref:Uncharacterized protein n=1 Tax=Trichomalopsis sarcophagae TaxID=543379 RepID=A0A232F7A9_9HYME|nr:hypothetical protein TSAR_001716 [Trichomalopsis sarcophagae]
MYGTHFLESVIGDPEHLNTIYKRFSHLNRVRCHVASPLPTVGTEELNTRISALETQLADNISASNRFLDANKLLLDENSTLRDKLQQTQQLLRKLHRARQDHDTGSMPVSDSGPILAAGPSIIIEREATEVAGERKCSSPRLAPTGGGAGSKREGAEWFEVIINGLVQDGFDEKISDVVAFALLGAILPALKKSNIASTRVLRMHRSGRAQRNRTTATKSATSRSVLPLLVVRLASPGSDREVMRAKSALADKYLTTNNIKPGVLDPEAAACLTGHKVFINEMLSQEKFSLFKNLRPIAQGLGFKYVWHAGGRGGFYPLKVKISR